MKITGRFFTVGLVLLGLLFTQCSAEDGQDGIAGKNGIDGLDGADGAPGQNGIGAIDLGWDTIQLEPQRDANGDLLPVIGFGPVLEDLTAEELSTFALFAYMRFPDNASVNFAIPANVIMGADEMSAIPYDISFFGIVNNQLLFLVERTDGVPIPADAVFPAFEFKAILVPSSSPAQKQGIALKNFLD